MNLLSKLTVARRLGLLVAASMLGLAGLLLWTLFSERGLLMHEREDGVRQAVEVAYGVVAHEHALAKAGGLSDDEARKRALAALEAMRYSGQEYFWVNDLQPKMVMHPIKKELVGQDLSRMVDPDGKHLFVEFVNTVRQQGGAGFVPYLWPKPDHKDPVPKVSYVKLFEPWGWVIGSGVYVDQIDHAVMDRLLEIGSGVGLIAVLLGLAGLLVARSVLRQLGGEPAYALAVTRQLAQGDMSVEVAVAAGTGSSLMQGIKDMRDRTSDIVAQVRQGSESVANASAEIDLGNHDLSARTERQASALEETSATLEELGATVQLNAEHVREASRLAQEASGVAVQAGEQMGQVIGNIRGINEAGRSIADIIGVIDGIAFQTNILALNAAVEAARAGEQGRGFAVVAGEVRTLATRSADAARQIRHLITDSVDRAAVGVHLVDGVGATMSQLVQGIRQVSNLMQDVSHATAEQSQAVAQVGEAIGHIDEATQQNAALVEEMAAAASSLKAQAAQLLQHVQVFRLAPAASPAMHAAR